MLQHVTSPLRRFDVAAPLAIALIYAWLLALTIPDYGIMWDAWEYMIGDHYLYYFATFDATHLDFAADSIRLYDDPNHPDFHAVTTAYPDNDALTQPLMIWPLGAMGAALSKQIFMRLLGIFGPYDASHLILLPYAGALLLSVWLFARRRFGRWQAMTALLVLVTYPRLWAHMHNNIKDVPTAVWFTLTIVAFVAGMRRRSWLWLSLSAVCWGLGLATKANGVFLPFILGPYFLALLWERRRAGQGLLTRREVIPLALYPLIGLGLMIALWPLLWAHFPDRLLEFIDTLRARGTSAGRTVDPATGEAIAATWNLWPLRYAFATMPPVVMALAALGLVLGWLRAWREPTVRADILLATLWTVVPVARVLMPGANDFDGIRHWLEFIPGLALLAGLGAGPLLQRLADRLTPPASAPDATVATAHPDAANDAADTDAPPPPPPWPLLAPLLVLVVLFAPTVVWIARNHPHQIVYFNDVVGGYAGARERGYPDASDYWCNSYRAGTDWLYEHAEPDSTLYIGVAEHLGFYTREVWIREDIAMLNLVGREPADVAAEIAAAPGPVYLMYTTRESWYHDLVRQAELNHCRIVHSIQVDGAPVLIIRDLKQIDTIPTAP